MAAGFMSHTSLGFLMVDKKRLRGPQFRAVEALEKLGSSLEHAQQGDGYVLLSKPFHADRTPSVEIFRDGGYRDWAEDTTGWGEIGLKSIGTYLDLEEAAEGRFQKVWNELEPLTTEGREYLEGRKISTEGLKSDGPAVCFPLWHGDKMVGIQRRFVDGRTPKNRCFAGSDASGLFYPVSYLGGMADNNVIFICEGATDSHTMAPYGMVAGVLSASTLSGLQEVIPSEGRKIVLCFDADAAGREAERKVLSMFPDQKFSRLVLGKYKDVNEMVCQQGLEGALMERITRDPTPDLEFIEGSLASAPEGLWLGWWPPEVPKGAPTSFVPKDGYSWYVFPHDIDPLKAREWCWGHKVSGYVVKEVSND